MIDAKLDLFDCSFNNHFNFLWHVNTSITRQNVYKIGTEIIHCKNIERQLGIHGFDPYFDRNAIPIYVFKKCIESTIQIINSIPIVGIATATLSAFVFYLCSLVAAGAVSKDIENLCPGQPEKSKTLLQLAKEHYLNEIDTDGNVSDFLLAKIASVILERPIENLEDLSQMDCETICKFLKITPNPLCATKQLLGHQFYTCSQKALYSNLYVAYWINLYVRSLLSIIPFFKVCLRTVQWVRGIQDGR